MQRDMTNNTSFACPFVHSKNPEYRGVLTTFRDIFSSDKPSWKQISLEVYLLFDSKSSKIDSENKASNPLSSFVTLVPEFVNVFFN